MTTLTGPDLLDKEANLVMRHDKVIIIHIQCEQTVYQWHCKWQGNDVLRWLILSLLWWEFMAYLAFRFLKSNCSSMLTFFNKFYRKWLEIGFFSVRLWVLQSVQFRSFPWFDKGSKMKNCWPTSALRVWKATAIHNHGKHRPQENASNLLFSIFCEEGERCVFRLLYEVIRWSNSITGQQSNTDWLTELCSTQHLATKGKHWKSMILS